MKSKYYTPKIEEFHVGFEYEKNFNGYDDKWHNEIIFAKFDDGVWRSNIDDVMSTIDDGCDNYRVKYLDKEDIESFGFKLKVENKFGITFANRLYSIVYSKMKNNHIEVFLIQPYINESDGLKFSGVIKNKSELKKLLIQLEIINE